MFYWIIFLIVLLALTGSMVAILITDKPKHSKKSKLYIFIIIVLLFWVVCHISCLIIPKYRNSIIYSSLKDDINHINKKKEKAVNKLNKFVEKHPEYNVEDEVIIYCIDGQEMEFHTIKGGTE